MNHADTKTKFPTMKTSPLMNQRLLHVTLRPQRSIFNDEIYGIFLKSFSAFLLIFQYLDSISLIEFLCLKKNIVAGCLDVIKSTRVVFIKIEMYLIFLKSIHFHFHL